MTMTPNAISASAATGTSVVVNTEPGFAKPKAVHSSAAKLSRKSRNAVANT